MKPPAATAAAVSRAEMIGRRVIGKADGTMGAALFKHKVAPPSDRRQLA